MLIHHNPPTVPAPPSNYSLGVSTSKVDNWLYISGQIGTENSKSISENTEVQLNLCWRHILAILADAKMTKENLIKVTTFLTSRDDIGLYRATRDAVLNETKTASTLVIVSELADPSWKVEIEAVAAN